MIQRCLVCGSECGSFLCEKCRNTVRLTQLFYEVLRYRPGKGGNALWDEIAEELSALRPSVSFRSLSREIAKMMPGAQGLYYEVIAVTGDASFAAKNLRPWIREHAAPLLSEQLSEEQRLRLQSLLLSAEYNDYHYDKAEPLAEALYQAAEFGLGYQAAYTLAEYYIYTRRYDRCQMVIENALGGINPAWQRQKLEELLENAACRQNGQKPAYLPAPKAGRNAVQEKYLSFINSLSIDAEISPKSQNIRPKPLSSKEYPYPTFEELRQAGFRSFVAYDVETTGLSRKYDSLTEIGAVRVVDGEVVEEHSFLFQELVKPYKKRIPYQVEQLTGITNEMVRSARPMWEVVADFADFVGDDILIGYNCTSFDNHFIHRAGRYANRLMENPCFDVLPYARRFKEMLGITGSCSLSAVSDALDIENPQAHRALADAVTTARVYLRLLELDEWL